MPCEICDHVFIQKHRIIPGQWGGKYEDGNVIDLCPNHHAAAHFLMRWYFHGKAKGEGADDRLLAYYADRPLIHFFEAQVKPVLIERMKATGRWYPYERSIADKEKWDEDEINRVRWMIELHPIYLPSHFDLSR